MFGIIVSYSFVYLCGGFLYLVVFYYYYLVIGDVERVFVYILVFDVYDVEKRDLIDKVYYCIIRNNLF